MHRRHDMPTLESYDTLPYESIPITETHVEGLAALGRLFGVATADPQRCRVLELGCAEGGNLIPMAFYLPASRFVGIDLSARQVQTGQRLIDRLGLGNVQLLHRDVMDGADDLGQFDFIIAHGLYSWVPQAVRHRVLAICRSNLAAGGIAYVSWNALPGWHTRAVMRDMLLHYVRRETSPRARLALAYRFLETFGEGLAAEAGDLAGILRAEVAYLRQAPPSYLYHEYLVETNEPMLFTDFMDHAQRHGLQYVADVDLHTLLPETLGAAGRAAVAGITDRIERIQAMDFLRARRFHRSLLTHATTPVRAEPDGDVLRQLAFHADLTSDEEIDLASTAPQVFVTPTGARYAVKHPLAKAAALWLASVYPDAVDYQTLYEEAARLVTEHGEAAFAQAEPEFAAQWLELLAWGAIRPAVDARGYGFQPPERPRAHALARALIEAGSDCLPSLRHTAVHLDEAGAQLLAMLDGEHDLDALAQAMSVHLAAKGHDFEKTPRSVQVMSVPSPTAPYPPAGEGSFEKSRRAFHASEDLAVMREACARLLWTFARNGLLSP